MKREAYHPNVAMWMTMQARLGVKMVMMVVVIMHFPIPPL